MLATYDVFSGGRVVLGVGSGWMEEEFRALQTSDFAARGAVTDEYIDIFKKVSAGGEVTHQGTHYNLEPVKCYPGSVQKPHPPVLIGGVSNRAVRRVAEKGDGWISVSLAPKDIPERMARLSDLCERNDRKLDDLWLCHKLFISIGVAQSDLSGNRKMGTGTPDEITEDLKRLRDQGYRSVIFRYPGFDAAEQTRQFDILADKIMPTV